MVQEGDAETIIARPRTDYVGRLVGLNLYPARVAGHTAILPGGFTPTIADSCEGDAFIAFPPSALALYPTESDRSPRNTWPATVAGIQRHGDNLRIQLAGPIAAAADITPAAAAHLRLVAGAQVWAALKAAETCVYPDHEVGD